MTETNPQHSVISQLLGRWIPAPWMSFLARTGREKPLAALCCLVVVAALVAAALYGWRYYQTLPKPLAWQASVIAPGLSVIEESGLVPQPLKLTFTANTHQVTTDPARIDLIGNEVSQGLRLSPNLEGRWQWLDGRNLSFVPEQDWPADTTFTVALGADAFAPDVALENDEIEFRTPPLRGQLNSIRFHQDPAKREDRRVFATVEFSHAIDADSIGQGISLGMRPSGTDKDTALAPQAFDTKIQDHGRTLHIISAPVTLPAQTSVMRLKISDSLQADSGEAELSKAVEADIRIPDISSFFRISKSAVQMLRDKKLAPHQTLILELTDDISPQALKEGLAVYLLPKRQNNDRWRNPGRVTEAVLDTAQRLSPKALPLQRDTDNLHSYRLDLPPRREIFLRINRGLTSANGYVLSEDYRQVLSLPAYPKEARIRSEGALISRDGEKKLGLMARGLPALKVEVGRVQPDAINHLVSQTGGDLDDPRFQNYRFSEDDIVSWNHRIINLAQHHPREPVFASLDLAPWLRQPLGLFFIRVQGWDPQNNRPIHSETDRRLILVSDLGLMVKRGADGRDQIFVQSVRSGQPVSNARVNLLGKNGEPIFYGQTESDGQVRVPDYSRASRERQPTVYVITRGDDVSFIPWQRAERRLGYSRFDIGGVESRYLPADALNAWLFSDRGIYRPGETAHLGVVLRRNDLGYDLGIPLEYSITDPKGVTVLNQRRKLPPGGFFEFDFVTEGWSPTGEYQAEVHLVTDRGHRGRLIGNTTLKIEEFQPDKLRISSHFEHHGNTLQPAGWINTLDLRARIDLQNLFGTAAQDRRVTAELRLNPVSFDFDEYPGYQFNDPDKRSEKTRSSLKETLTETRTNANGQAWFDLDLSRFEHGLWQVNVFAQGYEAGSGRGVATAITAWVSPAKHLLGIKTADDLSYLREGSDASLQLIAINPQLAAVALTDLRLRRSRLRQASTLVQAEDGSYSYQSMTHSEPLDERALRISDKGEMLTLDTSDAGDYQVDIVDAQGKILASQRYTVTGASNLAGALERDAELDIVLDQKEYRAGDEIELQITAPYTGAGLITIERDEVFAWQWFQADSRRSIQTIRIPDSLEGNAYVNVSFLRAIDSSEVYTRPLSYAVAPFRLERSQRQLSVQLQTNKLARPGEPLTIEYQLDEPAQLVVFAVDEGILQVAGYQTPSPLDHFLRKRALEVETQQILDLLLPEIRMLQRQAAAGGGESAHYLGKHLNPFARRGYKPAVYWSGLINAQAGDGTVQYTPPDSFNGRLRIMAVAVGEQRMGAARTDALVRAPFVITPALPTAVAPGDEFDLAVNLSHVYKDAGPLPITLTLNADQSLEVIGEHQATLNLEEGDEGRVVFRLRAGDTLGPAMVRLAASGGDTRSRLSSDLSIRPAMPYQTLLQTGYKKSGNVSLKTQRRLYPEHARRVITASTSPLALVDGLNDYLAEFPHYCTEQIVSQVFPLLTFIDQPQFAAHYSRNNDHSLKSVIHSLRGRQLAGGGFELWPGLGRPQAWASVHAMLFLSEARLRGQPVPGEVLEQGWHYLRAVAVQPSRSLASARVRAQAVYLLTRAGETTTNQLVHLHEGLERDHADTWTNDVVSSWMAASYQLLQKSAQAQKLIKTYTTGRKSLINGDDHDSVLAQDAQHLWLLSQHFPARVKQLQSAVLQSMLQPVFNEGYNSLSSAWTVLALGAYEQTRPTIDKGDIHFTASNNQNQPVTLTSLDSAYPAAEANGVLAATLQGVSISGPADLYYSMASTGFDQILPDQPHSAGLEIDRSYLDSEGKTIEQFTQGQEITVRMRVRSKKQAVDNAVIMDLLPGGFEIDSNSLSRSFDGWQADYIDVREDRVLIYGPMDTRMKEVTYKVRATTTGRFTLPPAQVESMYNRSLHAHTAGGEIEVHSHQDDAGT